MRHEGFHLAQRREMFLASVFLMAPAGGVLVAHSGLLPLRIVLLLLTPPAVVAAGILSVRALYTLGARLATYGLLAGFAASLAYDGVRLLLYWLELAADPFRSITLYGLLIAGPDSPQLARFAGWLFHFWNGASFGIFYALAFRRPTILTGLLWGLFLELALVVTSPKLLFLTIRGELLAASLIGHIAYGATLALVVRRAMNVSDRLQTKESGWTIS